MSARPQVADFGERPIVRAEAVAYWFFRLNGFLTIVNFILHPDRSSAQRTDADIVGVRFQHRAELSGTGKPLVDHPHFQGNTKADIVVAEVKGPRDYCQLNGPWTDPSRGNMAYLFQALGVFPKPVVEEVSDSLYRHGTYADGQFSVRLFAIGGSTNPELDERAAQLTYRDDLLPFIFRRFHDHGPQKKQNDQWDHIGRGLYSLAMETRDANEFATRALEFIV